MMFIMFKSRLKPEKDLPVGALLGTALQGFFQ